MGRGEGEGCILIVDSLIVCILHAHSELFLLPTASYFCVILPPVSMSYCLLFLYHTTSCFYVILPYVSTLYSLLFLYCTTFCFYVILPCVSMSYWRLTRGGSCSLGPYGPVQ